MLILNLNLGGDCVEAIALYEKAFNTTAMSVIKNKETGSVKFALISIHGQMIHLNDKAGNKDRTTDTAISITIHFNSIDELRSCYEIMEPGSITLFPLEKVPASKLSVEFIDRFGIQWCFYDASIQKR